MSFALTMFFIFWRPRGINEAIPATVGAILIFLCGGVTLQDLGSISVKISGASLTIIATLVMALTLEGIGFFRWVSIKMMEGARGSGIRLYWLTNLLCFLMTLFLNNDGSILITTPILIMLLKHLRMKHHQMLPYLISGSLIATASSAPIGVSNIVNLISLEIIEMDLYLHTMMMFVPGTLGLLFLATLLFFLFYPQIPKKLPNSSFKGVYRLHPLASEAEDVNKQTRVMKYVLLYVFFVRISLFIASYLGFSVSLVAIFASVILLAWRWYYLNVPPMDLMKRAPWHIFIFAFSMYIIIYGLKNIGLTTLLVDVLEPLVSDNLFHANFIMGILLSILSNLFNNHPALMIGTITLTEMTLDPLTLKAIYLANIIGSDMGALLLPTGTLATLMWFHILRKNKVLISWAQYIKITVLTIPLSVIVTLYLLYFWIETVFQ